MVFPFLIQGDNDMQIFTGTPHGPSANLESKTTQLATTEFVQKIANSNVSYDTYNETLTLERDSGNKITCYIPTWGWIPPSSVTVTSSSTLPLPFLYMVGSESKLKFSFQGGSHTFWSENFTDLFSSIRCKTNNVESNISSAKINIIDKSVEININAQADDARIYTFVFNSPSGNSLVQLPVISNIEKNQVFKMPVSVDAIVTRSNLPLPYLMVKNNKCIIKFVFDSGTLWTNTIAIVESITYTVENTESSNVKDSVVIVNQEDNAIELEMTAATTAAHSFKIKLRTPDFSTYSTTYTATVLSNQIFDFPTIVQTTKNIPIVTIGQLLTCASEFSSLQDLSANATITQISTSNAETITSKNIENNLFNYTFPITYDGGYRGNILLTINNTQIQKEYAWGSDNFLNEANIYTFPDSLNWTKNVKLTNESTNKIGLHTFFPSEISSYTFGTHLNSDTLRIESKDHLGWRISRMNFYATKSDAENDIGHKWGSTYTYDTSTSQWNSIPIAISASNVSILSSANASVPNNWDRFFSTAGNWNINEISSNTLEFRVDTVSDDPFVKIQIGPYSQELKRISFRSSDIKWVRLSKIYVTDANSKYEDIRLKIAGTQPVGSNTFDYRNLRFQLNNGRYRYTWSDPFLDSWGNHLNGTGVYEIVDEWVELLGNMAPTFKQDSMYENEIHINISGGDGISSANPANVIQSLTWTHDSNITNIDNSNVSITQGSISLLKISANIITPTNESSDVVFSLVTKAPDSILNQTLSLTVPSSIILPPWVYPDSLSWYGTLPDLIATVSHQSLLTIKLDGGDGITDNTIANSIVYARWKQGDSSPLTNISADKISIDKDIPAITINQGTITPVNATTDITIELQFRNYLLVDNSEKYTIQIPSSNIHPLIKPSWDPDNTSKRAEFIIDHDTMTFDQTTNKWIGVNDTFNNRYFIFLVYENCVKSPGVSLL